MSSLIHNSVETDVDEAKSSVKLLSSVDEYEAIFRLLVVIGDFDIHF
jgi:hypothetical protein